MLRWSAYCDAGTRPPCIQSPPQRAATHAARCAAQLTLRHLRPANRTASSFTSLCPDTALQLHRSQPAPRQRPNILSNICRSFVPAAPKASGLPQPDSSRSQETAEWRRAPMDEEASGQAAAPDLPPRPPASTASPSPDLPPSPVVAPPLLDPPLPHSQNGGPPTGQAAEMEVEESYGAAPASPRGSRQYSSGSGGGNQAAAALIRRPGTELWAFGRGDCGQLGTGASEDAHVPRMIGGLRGRDVVNAAPGALHSAAVTCECLRSRCCRCLNCSSC